MSNVDNLIFDLQWPWTIQFWFLCCFHNCVRIVCSATFSVPWHQCRSLWTGCCLCGSQRAVKWNTNCADEVNEHVLSQWCIGTCQQVTTSTSDRGNSTCIRRVVVKSLQTTNSPLRVDILHKLISAQLSANTFVSLSTVHDYTSTSTVQNTGMTKSNSAESW